MATGLLELALVLTLAALMGIAARLFRQPIILAYLVAGIIAGWFGVPHLASQSAFELFAELGIMLVLFMVGLEINYSSLRLVGRQSLLIGFGQVVFTFLIGFALVALLGFNVLASGYLAVALTLSSTVIVVKLLSDKRDLHSLYGRLSIGVLLVQDLVAVIILVVLAGLSESQHPGWGDAITALVKGAVLFGAVLWLGRTVLPKVFNRIARSTELLFVASIAWMLLLATLITRLGFSVEIAGFLAGLALANSAENFEIAGRLRPLRDFFLIIFFVVLGASLAQAQITGILITVILLSLFVLVGNPIIVMLIMGLLGYRRRTSFLAGLAIAQISEFSLILATLGHRLGHLTRGETSIITAVAVITIAGSSYLISHADYLFRLLAKPLGIFERRKLREELWPAAQIRRQIVLIGCHRLGQSILAHLPKNKVLVVDFDPEVTSALHRRGFEYLLGDIADQEIQERAHLAGADLVISTSPDYDDNASLISELKRAEPRPVIVLRAETEVEAKLHYRAGADYVLLPYLTSGYHLGQALAQDLSRKQLAKLRATDEELLRHPVIKPAG
ncbi:MAG: cation:proton antiporter [Candidatus Liptonbacteria bacterium]|nr:cation:proton antiporter [Candidatus Liptonbacteria bacterium]